MATAWVFIWQLSLGSAGFERASYALGVIPAVLSGHGLLSVELDILPPPLTLFTALFLHDNGFLASVNAACLWTFGQAVESAMTAVNFVIFFLVCGTFAGLAATVYAPQSNLPLIGADAAVAGIFSAYLLLSRHPTKVLVIPLVARAIPRPVALSGLSLLWLAVHLSPLAPALSWPAYAVAAVTGVILMLFMKRREVALFS